MLLFSFAKITCHLSTINCTNSGVEIEFSVRMAAHRSVVYRGMEPRRSYSSDDRVSVHTSLSPISKDFSMSLINPGLNNVSNYGSSHDSGIHMDEDTVSPVESTYLSPEQDTECLQDELFSALIPTYQERRGFFAKHQISKILTEDRVRNELTRHFEDSLSEATIAKHAKTICHGAIKQAESPDYDGQQESKSFIKVLAILIIIEKTKSIIKLLEDDVNDSDLPLIKIPRPNDEKLFDLRSRRKPDVVLRCFQRKWNQLNIRNFEEWQWTTLPVDFGQPMEHGEVKHLQLEEQKVLPFTEDSREQKPHFSRRTELEGGFASVFKVAIHPQHHNFRTSPDKPDPASFAVKRLHSQNEEAFKREVEMLNKFSGNKHDHLISLLATYEQFDRFFLVFDWAEADLQGYWKRINPAPSFDLDTVLWMARQCKGIASGIIKIHAHVSTYQKKDPNGSANENVVFGHHGDIKPENVLWFCEPSHTDRNVGGTLKLSDFGLAEFSIHQTTSMPPKSKWGVSLAYRAPESDLKQGNAIGRSYDIWTLGCLYLEFITWMLGGSQLLDEFAEARKARDAMWHEMETHTFFKLEIDDRTRKPTAIIKPAVKEVSLISSRKVQINLLILI